MSNAPRRPVVAGLLAVAASAVMAASPALGGDGGGIKTRADYTPFDRFTPLASSAVCSATPASFDDPFVVPAGYRQDVLAFEGQGGTDDLWDMNSHNETGKQAGRYLYRTHEVGGVPADADPNRPGGPSQVSVLDLWTGDVELIAQRNDWERFDGIAWTSWETLLVAEETIRQSFPDPQVPQARGGLLYELFLDRNDPTELDPSRERIVDTAGVDRDGDGTIDTVRDGIRARPMVGARSHEGIRFDKRGYLYGIAESRGQSMAGQSGAIFRFIPDRKDDLGSGQLFAFQADARASYGAGRWIPLDRAASTVDSDAEAERRGASEYQRPEDVETATSTGKDRVNGGHTLYVAITEGAEMGVLAMDLHHKDRPFAYPYVGPAAGNTPADFQNPDNVALDARGNLAITEDPSTPPGADIWIAAPPRSSDVDGQRGASPEPARTVQRFASLKDCAAEPSGIYFSAEEAVLPRYAVDPATGSFIQDGFAQVTKETLFVHVQHAGQSTDRDRLVAITPVDGNDD